MADGRPKFLIVFAIVASLSGHCNGADKYFGKFLGKLSELHHGVSGEIYAVDARTLHIKDFTYDGEGPAAYFWAGSTRSPGSTGFRVRDENGSGAVLKRYRRKSITLTLPDGKNLNNIKWFSVWCEEFAVNFGDVKIPRNFDYPKPQKIDGLRGVHGVSSDNIVIVDAQTLLVPNFSYDGEAPDAKFWVGRGSKPSPQGIRVPDENGKEVPLRRYDRKTVVLTLPGDLTIFDIGHFGVWCEAFTVDFGHVRIPAQLNVPPSLKMLGVSPQSKLNCEVLYDDLAFEVRWAVAGESIVLQLVAKLDDNEYMSFGLSGDNSKTEMIGGDVVVAWVDKNTLKGYAEDYYLEAKSQCSGPRGSCPDERIAENTNNIRLLNAAMVNGYSIVTYQRPLKANDEYDRKIYTNQSQAIVWAIGPLNQRNEVSFHSQYTKKDHFIDFGRPARWNCPMPDDNLSSSTQTQTQTQTNQQNKKTTPAAAAAAVKEEVEIEEATTRSNNSNRRRGGSRETTTVAQISRRRTNNRGSATAASSIELTPRPVPTPKPVNNRNAWFIPPIQCDEPDDGVFYAQMGPTGGKRGYPAITGHVGWGISWYINGLLIPEINVVRGKTYTFVVEGGLDPEVPAKYHPFYITDDPIGGYEYKTPEERQNVRIFAGVKQTRDGKVFPTGVGRLCHWTHTGDLEADDFHSFGAFQRTLELRCDDGEPGVITWTPDEKTPDTVYYQCFTHRYLGWKINVLDACDSRPEASEPEASIALPDNNGELKSSPSIIVETRIKPNELFQTTQTKYSDIVTNSQTSYHRQFHDLSSDVPRTNHEDAIVTVEPNTDSFSTDIITIASSTTSSPVRRPIKLNKKPPIRRPPTLNRPPFIMKPVMLTMHRLPMQAPFKKSFYRIPSRKRPAAPAHRTRRPKPSTTSTTNQEPNIVIVKYPQYNNTNQTKTQTKYSSELISIKKELDDSSSTTMRPAINTGFHPESVVIEGGFKPIITKELQERKFDDYENQQEDLGVIKLNSEQYIEPFEPMFIPSPTDSHLLLNKKQNQAKTTKTNLVLIKKKNPPRRYIVKHVARSVDYTDVEEPEVAMESERVESYYLPPDDRKPVAKIKKPSNIDIPAGTLITFDGKIVSDKSLTAPTHHQSGNFESRSSKSAELLRKPQFGPFTGETPPLETRNINLANLPQLNSQSVINRDLNAPLPTTKLSPVGNYARGARNRRSPHHTPEHTAEQQKEQKGQKNQGEHDGKSQKNGSSHISFNFICVIIVSFINKYL